MSLDMPAPRSGEMAHAYLRRVQDALRPLRNLRGLRVGYSGISGAAPRIEVPEVDIFWARQTGPDTIEVSAGNVHLRGQVDEVATDDTLSVVGFDDGAFYVWVKSAIRVASNAEIVCSEDHPSTTLDLNEHAYLILVKGAVVDELITEFGRRWRGGDWYLHGL